MNQTGTKVLIVTLANQTGTVTTARSFAKTICVTEEVAPRPASVSVTRVGLTSFVTVHAGEKWRATGTGHVSKTCGHRQRANVCATRVTRG